MADRTQTVWIAVLLIVMALVAVLGTSGCEGEGQPLGQSIASDADSSYGLVLLFTDDQGCKVKRFRDAGTLRYYVVCPDVATQTQYNVSCGKNCTRNETIETAR